MIDDMVVILRVRHTADDEKKERRTVSLDTADDKKKALEHSIAGLETSITKTEYVIDATKEKIGALEGATKALDKMLAEAMEQRKEGTSSLTFRSKKFGFEKVIVIDHLYDMVVILEVGHTADDEEKEHCTVSLDLRMTRRRRSSIPWQANLGVTSET